MRPLDTEVTAFCSVGPWARLGRWSGWIWTAGRWHGPGSGWQVLRYIMLPLMAPILWLILLLRAIDAFKVIDIPTGLTLGGPGRATEYFSLFNYRTARKFFDYGGAAAQAFLLLVIVMVLVSLLWGKIKHVYEQEERAPA